MSSLYSQLSQEELVLYWRLTRWMDFTFGTITRDMALDKAAGVTAGFKLTPTQQSRVVDAFMQDNKDFIS